MRIYTQQIQHSDSPYLVIQNIVKRHFPQLSHPQITHTTKGKPFIKELPDIALTISHAHSDVAVGFAKKGVRIGVDVEDKWSQAIRVYRRFCTPSEQRLIINDGIHPLWFWCAKEACFKAFSDLIHTPYSNVVVTAKNKNKSLTAHVEGIGELILPTSILPSGAALVYLHL